MRSRVSLFGLFALTGLLLSAKGAAQESPEFGDDSIEEPTEGSDGSEPMMTTMGDANAAPMAAESEPSNPGYADSAENIVADAVAVDEEDEAGKAAGAVLGVDLATFIGGGKEGSRLTLSPIATLGVGISDNIQVGVSWGFNYQSNGAPDALPMANTESAFVVGNPNLWIAHHSQKGQTHFVMGGGITFPFATIPDEPADQAITASALMHASAVRGDWNQWLWSTDRASGVVNFAGQAIMDELLFGGEGAVAVLAPTASKGQLAAAGQAAGEVGYATDRVSVVMRAQVVATIAPDVDDAFQFSIDPYVAWKLSPRTTLSARFTVNLDQPTGFDSLNIWGLRLGANVSF